MSYNTWFGIVLIGTITLSVLCNSEKLTDRLDIVDPNMDVSAAKRPSFFVGSRYGRSQYGSSQMRNLNVVPRNDRFFLGSRYGKRSEEYMQDVVEPETSKDSINPTGLVMTCTYTGVKDFYRCFKVKENINIGQIVAAAADISAASGIDVKK